MVEVVIRFAAACRRVQARWLAALGLVLPLLFAPAIASADVIEIGSGGYAWVAGGPAAPQVGNLVEPAPPASDAAIITAIQHSAGPEAWQGHVAVLSAKYDLSPALIEALVWQESRWKPAARSPVGAFGLAQLMPGTARDLGVDAGDPAANLEGGARYLRMQLDTFNGDIEKALAAYNAGPGRVIRAGGIPAIRETQGYVSAIMARLAAPVR